MERYSKENPTLPVGAGKIRVFKEGPVRWNDVKFLNQGKLDWITNYVRARQSRLSIHLKKAPQEQVRIAAIAGANNFTLANNRGVQSTSSKTLNESTSAASDSSQAAASSNSKAGSLPQQQEELFDSDDDMYNRKFEPGQPIDFCQSDRWYQ